MRRFSPDLSSLTLRHPNLTGCSDFKSYIISLSAPPFIFSLAGRFILKCSFGLCELYSLKFDIGAWMFSSGSEWQRLKILYLKELHSNRMQLSRNTQALPKKDSVNWVVNVIVFKSMCTHKQIHTHSRSFILMSKDNILTDWLLITSDH